MPRRTQKKMTNEARNECWQFASSYYQPLQSCSGSFSVRGCLWGVGGLGPNCCLPWHRLPGSPVRSAQAKGNPVLWAERGLFSFCPAYFPESSSQQHPGLPAREKWKEHVGSGCPITSEADLKADLDAWWEEKICPVVEYRIHLKAAVFSRIFRCSVAPEMVWCNKI